MKGNTPHLLICKALAPYGKDGANHMLQLWAFKQAPTQTNVHLFIQSMIITQFTISDKLSYSKGGKVCPNLSIFLCRLSDYFFCSTVLLRNCGQLQITFYHTGGFMIHSKLLRFTFIPGRLCGKVLTVSLTISY